MAEYITAVYFDSPNGTVLGGPIMFDGNEYMFIDQHSGSDLYFRVKKSEQGWYYSGGPDIFVIPQTFVDAVGEQIDKQYQENNK
ncbi:hypothetical protein [Mucilaginibacter lacusdianchii]|uniref:hypothetical protein n=1 Tax=Mucilaginibacter lacusdianchii TaxID=2684211 RepID=UPI00131D1364|nr:hypothetical protein [Mucilaginibacter sp. JXJ CY 39]